MKFSLVAIGREIQSFPYLYKLYSVLDAIGEVEYVFWDRDHKDKNITSVDRLTYKPILSFSPGGKLSLLIGYCLWFFKVFLFMLLKSDKDTLYLASRLDSAAAIYLAAIFRKKIRYVYLDRDAYFMTYNFGLFKNVIKWIETIVSKNAVLHFIPGESRNFTSFDNVRIIQNTPKKSFFEQAKIRSKNLDVNSKFTIYVNGWLVPTRGAEMISTFAKALDPELYQIIVAGPLQCPHIKSLVAESSVKYLGVLDNIDALSYYFVSDLVLCFYDPSIEINKKAEPNKWFDCLFTETVFVTNFGIETAQPFYNLGLCKLIEYGNSNELFELVETLRVAGHKKNDINYEFARQELFVDFWDVKVESIIKKYISSCNLNND